MWLVRVMGLGEVLSSDEETTPFGMDVLNVASTSSISISSFLVSVLTSHPFT